MTFFDVRVGAAASGDRLHEILLVMWIRMTAEHLVLDHGLVVFRADKHLPATVVTAHDHHGLGAINFDSRGILQPVGKCIARPNIARGFEEFAAPAFDDQVALGWSVVRDGSRGRPPLMWIPHCRSESAAYCSATAAVTYGCLAAMNVPLRDLGRDAPMARELFTSSFEMGKKGSPYMAYARPIPFAALHISERSRNARYPNAKKMWGEVFSPALGGYRALKEEHVPWVVTSDLDLAETLDLRSPVVVASRPRVVGVHQKRRTDPTLVVCQDHHEVGRRIGTSGRLQRQAAVTESYE